MQIILREDVPSVGKSGQLLTVKDGFGRNYLLPRRLAVLASSKNIRQLDHEKRLIEAQEKKRMKTAQAQKDRLESLSINIAKQVGEENKLFGSVTTKEIADALANEGITIDRKIIQLQEPIKTLGVHNVTIRLSREVNADLKVWVVSK